MRRDYFGDLFVIDKWVDGNFDANILFGLSLLISYVWRENSLLRLMVASMPAKFRKMQVVQVT
jgi:hypothetical protein